MRRYALIILILIALLLLGPAAYRYLTYYGVGGGDGVVEPPSYDPSSVIEQVPLPPTGDFFTPVDSDEVSLAIDVTDGIVLIDQAHDNNFTLDEITIFTSYLSDRGLEVRPYRSGDNLVSMLRGASSFVSMVPLEPFDQAEVTALGDFVASGGHLLLIGDPARFDISIEDDGFNFVVQLLDDELPLNSLANAFDINFEGDYLYNLSENDSNFRNILMESADFSEAESALTANLETIAFYGSHSVSVGNDGAVLMAADAETASSSTDRSGGLATAVSSVDGRVIGLGDINFMIEPNFVKFDNSQFIANLADFLGRSERSFTLSDFPYLLSPEIDLIYTGETTLGPDVFDEVIAFQNGLQGAERTINLAAENGDGNDVIYLGLYNQAEEVADLLEAAGITLTIEPPVLPEDEQEEDDEEEVEEEDDEADAEDVIQELETPFGPIQMSGTAVILYDTADDKNTIVVLAASQEGLENTIGRLLDLTPLNSDYVLDDCLTTDTLALCPTGINGEEVEAELDTGGVPDGANGNGNGGDDGDDGDDGADDEPPFEGELQGTLEIDDYQETTIEPETNHIWVIEDQGFIIDLTVYGEDDFDGVVDIYDGDNDLIASIDFTLSGEPEVYEDFELINAPYSIVVYDFFNDGGAYAIETISTGEIDVPVEPDDGDASGEIETILIYSDYDGDLLSDEWIDDGPLLLEALIFYGYDARLLTSTDGLITEDDLDGVDLLIWDTGAYFDEERFISEDADLILNWAFDEGNPLLTIGSQPGFFSFEELLPVSDLEVVAVGSPSLTEGFDNGQTFDLLYQIDAVFLEVFGDPDPNEQNFILRGSNSDEAGAPIAAAFFDEFANNKLAYVAVPYSAMPFLEGEQVLLNLLAWFVEAE